MISQKCPKCFSKRIRRGYRPTPLWSKILFRYNLLCDNCNWEFTGFAVPGTVSSKPTKRSKKSPAEKKNHKDDGSASARAGERLDNLVSLDNLTGEKSNAGKKS